jgi:predicted ribosome quality control (RQC) complex YloA/Tae2 family protein
VLGSTAVKNIIEAIRDRLVQRSLIGKRKLDRTATRRQLDALLRELGERYRALVRTGRMEVPAELSPLVQQVRDLEAKLEAQEKEIEALENEQPSTT